MTEILPGAEPFSASGGPHGALVVHGFTGCPQSMRPIAEGFASAGWAVELPRLPGHGTSLEDMATTRWDDWITAAEKAYLDLAGRVDRVAVIGLSMGGTISAWLAASHPEVAGVVAINAAVEPAGDAFVDMLRQTRDQGVQFAPGVGNDVADPEVTELAYDQFPVDALLSLVEAQRDLAPRLAEIRCPVLVITSRQDHVVTPANSDFLASAVTGPVERVWLERSYHVATIDFDRDEIVKRALEFASRAAAVQ